MSLDDRGNSVRVLERVVIRTVERGVHRSSQFSSVMSLGDANCQGVILGTATWDMYGCHAEVLALLLYKQVLQRFGSHFSCCCRVCHIYVIFHGCVRCFSGTVTRESRYRKVSPRACAEQQTWCRWKGSVLSFLHSGSWLWVSVCFGYWRRDNKSRGEGLKGQG